MPSVKARLTAPVWLLSRAGRVLQLCWCLAEEKQTVCRRHLMEGFPQTQANGNSSAVSLGASILDLGAAFCPLSRQLDPMGLTLHSLHCSGVSLRTGVLPLPWPMLTLWSLLPQPQSKVLLLPQTLCFAGKELGASQNVVWAGIWGSWRVLPAPKESSWKHEWARGKATKRGIRKQKELFLGGGGCLHEGGQEFLFFAQKSEVLSSVPLSLHGAPVNNIPRSACGRRRAKHGAIE